MRSIGVWGASSAQQKALRRKRKILRYVDGFIFRSDEEQQVGDYIARIFFIREDAPPSLREFIRKVEAITSRTFVIGQTTEFKTIRMSVDTAIDELVEYFQSLQQQSSGDYFTTGDPDGDALRTGMIMMGFPGQSRPASSSGKTESDQNKDLEGKPSES